MPLSLAFLAIAASTQAPTAACTQLMRDFVTNEYTLGVMHDMNNELLAAEEKLAHASGNYLNLNKQMETAAADDQRILSKADRITNLMAGLHCKLPDHVADPATFRTDGKACREAKGTDRETEACGYIERAVKRWARSR